MRTMLIVCWLCSIASASPETPSSPSARGRKDPTTARSLSLGSTLIAGTGLFVAGALLREHGENGAANLAFAGGGIGLLVGPSVGHIYTEDAMNRWLGLRVGGLGVAAVGGMLAIASALDDWDNSSGGNGNGGAGAGIALMGIGAVGFAAGVVGDIVTASSSADAYNVKHSIDVHLTPAPIVTPAGVTPGVGLVGRF
jgi:hypothetical protein